MNRIPVLMHGARVAALFAVLAILSVSHASAQSWKPISKLGVLPRGDYAYAAAPDLGASGRIYTFGGRMFTGTANVLYNVIEMYDIATDTWMTLEPTTPLANRMYHHAAYINGKFYLTGGFLNTFGNATGLIEEFDPVTLATREITPTGTVPVISGRPAATSAMGKVYTFGGFVGSSDNLSVNIFDPVANTWETVTPTGDAIVGMRGYLAATAVGSDIFVTGGLGGETGYQTFNTNQKYSISTGSVTTMTPLFSDLHSHGAVAVDGKIYFIGGMVDINGNPNFYPFMFNPNGGELDSYTPLFFEGGDQELITGSVVAVGDLIFQLGAASRFDTLAGQVLDLSPSSVSTKSHANGVTFSQSASVLTVESSGDIMRSIAISDVTGRSHMKLSVSASNVSIDLRMLTSGLYIVHVVREGGSSTGKVMIR
jgi:hypothetical protein